MFDAMKLSESVRPISYLKSNTAKALREITESGKTMVITQDGEAKAVLVVDQLEARCFTLADFPLRGHIPKELELRLLR